MTDIEISKAEVFRVNARLFNAFMDSATEEDWNYDDKK